MKKIIKIETGKFLYEAHNDRITFVDNIQKALDISNWNFEQVSWIMGNLSKLEYSPKVIEVANNK